MRNSSCAASADTLCCQAQAQAAVAAAAQDAQAPGRAPSPGMQLSGQTSFGQLFDWPSSAAPPLSNKPLNQVGQAPPAISGPSLGSLPTSQWDPPVQCPAASAMNMNAFLGASLAPASLPPGPFQRQLGGGEDAPPSGVFAAPGGGLLANAGSSFGGSVLAPGAGSTSSLDGLGAVMHQRARSPWTSAEEARAAQQVQFLLPALKFPAKLVVMLLLSSRAHLRQITHSVLE